MTVASSLSTFRNRTRATSGVADRAASELTDRFTERRAMTDGGATTNGVSDYENYGGVGGGYKQHVSDGSLITETLSMPSVVPPNAYVTAEVLVKNNARIIFNDPDECNTGLFRSGYDLTVDGTAGNQDLGAQSKCIPGDGGDHTFDFDILTPSTPGTYTARFVVEGSASGNRLGVEQQSFEVRGDAPDPPDPGDDPNNPSGCSAIDVILGRNDCTIEDITDPSDFLLLGGGAMLVILLIFVVAG